METVQKEIFFLWRNERSWAALYKTKGEAWFVFTGFINEENVGVGRSQKMFLRAKCGLPNSARLDNVWCRHSFPQDSHTHLCNDDRWERSLESLNAWIEGRFPFWLTLRLSYLTVETNLKAAINECSRELFVYFGELCHPEVRLNDQSGLFSH